MDQKTQEEFYSLISELNQKIKSLENDIRHLKSTVSQANESNYPNYTEEQIEAICEEARLIEKMLIQKQIS